MDKPFYRFIATPISSSHIAVNFSQCSNGSSDRVLSELYRNIKMRSKFKDVLWSDGHDGHLKGVHMDGPTRESTNHCCMDAINPHPHKFKKETPNCKNVLRFCSDSFINLNGVLTLRVRAVCLDFCRKIRD